MSPRRLRHRSSPALQAGFTLLEVLVATAILGVAVTTLLGLHARNLSLAADAETLTVAGTLAGDVLALAQLDPAIEEGSTKGRFVASRSDADDRSSVYGGLLSPRFSWARDVMPTALPNLRQVRVRVHLAGDERVLAELWGALPVKRATLTLPPQVPGT